MMRFSALFLAAPLAARGARRRAQAQAGLAQVQAHLRAVQTMTAGFTQTDARGRSLAGTLTIKRPGRIRFDYGRAANMLIVGDGRALTFLDYVGQPAAALADQRFAALGLARTRAQDLSRFARVVRGRSPVSAAAGARPAPARIRHDHRPLRQVRRRARRADPRRAGTRSTRRTTAPVVRLSGQRFNVPVADSAFSYRPIQRRGRAPLSASKWPDSVHRRDRWAVLIFRLRLRVSAPGFPPVARPGLRNRPRVTTLGGPRSTPPERGPSILGACDGRAAARRAFHRRPRKSEPCPRP